MSCRSRFPFSADHTAHTIGHSAQQPKRMLARLDSSTPIIPERGEERSITGTLGPSGASPCCCFFCFLCLYVSTSWCFFFWLIFSALPDHASDPHTPFIFLKNEGLVSAPRCPSPLPDWEACVPPKTHALPVRPRVCAREQASLAPLASYVDHKKILRINYF